jgi:hypothetical protein
MALVYRLLGMVAPLNKGLSERWLTVAYRVPIAPLLILVLIGLVAAICYCVLSAREGLLNDPTPISLSFKEVPGRADLTNRYVSVAGLLVPQGSQTFITKRSSGEETIDAVYVPFEGEDEASAVLLVKYAGRPGEKDAHPATVTGMLRAPDERLQEKAAHIKARFAPATIDLTNVLVADDYPANPWLFGPLAIASALLFGMLLFTYFTGSTVYRRLGRPVPELASPLSEGELRPFLDLRVSGTFTEHGGSVRYFHDAPSHLVPTGTGDLALETQLVTDNKETTTCSIVLKLATITSWDVGWLYFGFTVQPGVRLRFFDGNTNRATVVYVKFPDEAHRRAFLAEVSRIPGYKLD